MELTDAQRTLVEDHLWLVENIAWKWRRRVPSSVEKDDLVQAGNLGLINAAQRFDATRPGASFRLFATYRVVGAIRDYLRDLDLVSKYQRGKIAAGAAEEVVEVGMESVAEMTAPTQTPEDAMMALDFSEQLRALVEGLDGKQRTIIQQYYFADQRISAIASEMQCSESLVSVTHKATLAKLRELPAFVVRREAFRFALTSGLLGRLGSAALGLVAAFLLTAFGLNAQTSVTPVNIVARGCAGPNVQIAVTVPLVAGTITVPVPVCAELGAGLTLNTTTNPPRIEITLPAVPYRAVVQKFQIPQIPDGVNSASFNLTYVPHPASPILVSFASSRVGGNVVDSVMPAGGASPKVVQVSLPNYRPFTADDVLTIVYWTLDAP